jgi:hypothetical protein
MFSGYRDLSVLNQATSRVKVGDEDVDPASAQRCPDGPVLAGSAGNANTPGYVPEVGGSDAYHALIEWCVEGRAVGVEEPEADVTDGSGAAELVLFGIRERVTALPQQR